MKLHPEFGVGHMPERRTAIFENRGVRHRSAVSPHDMDIQTLLKQNTAKGFLDVDLSKVA